MTALIYVIGPSGAGKDSIIEYARRNLPAGFPAIFAHRYITRPANCSGEVHVPLEEQEFHLRHERELFALSWESHGLRYGLGKEIDFWLDVGLTVIMNGSRSYLPLAAQRYANLLPVLIRVSPRILEQRLQRRGRESSEQIAARLDRAIAFEVNHPRLLAIDNNDDLEVAGRKFLEIIKEVTRTKETV